MATATAAAYSVWLLHTVGTVGGCRVMLSTVALLIAATGVDAKPLNRQPTAMALDIFVVRQADSGGLLMVKKDSLAGTAHVKPNRKAAASLSLGSSSIQS